jgi:hypothetical protein
LILWLLSGCGNGDDDSPNGVGGQVEKAIVVNGSSDNISLVDIVEDQVTSDLGGITIGPNVNRVAVRGKRAYIVNSGAFPGSTGASVQVIDFSTNTLINTIPFPGGDNPWAIAFISGTKAYVTCLYGNNVTVIDPTQPGASAISKTIPMPEFDGPSGPVDAGPEGIIVVGGYAYVANTGFDAANFGYLVGSVSVIDTATDQIVDVDSDPANGTDTPIPLTGRNAQDLEVDGEGDINVICTGNYDDIPGVMDVIDPDSWSVTTSVPLGGSPGNISIGNNLAVIGAGDADSCDLYVVRTNTNSAEHDSSNPLNLMDTSGWCTVGKIAVSSGGQHAYVPAGDRGGEAKLFELSLQPGNLQTTQTFDLEPGADLPTAAGMLY